MVQNEDGAQLKNEAEDRTTADHARSPGGPGAAPISACTIVSKNYLSLARVWHESVQKHHPGARTFVLIVDRIGKTFDPRSEPFEVIEVEELGIPGFLDLAFKYTILELNTAVKPFFMEFLVLKRGIENLVYLDPDTRLYAPMSKVVEALEQENIVLVPHILSPLDDDGKRPTEIDFLVSGTYNLGFIAIRDSEETRKFLRWWKDRLIDYGFSAPEKGLFTDQKWIDLVPTIFSGVRALKDRGYNVAYWNLQERLDLSIVEGGYRFPETPLVFFHFSGIELGNPERVSKYQTRFRLHQLGPVYRKLFLDYVQSVKDSGFETTRVWPYAFGQFDDGVPIAPLFRQFFVRQGKDRHRWANPFHTPGRDTFRGWMLEPVSFGSSIPRFLADLYRLRSDLQTAFPGAERDDPVSLLDWATRSLPVEYGIDGFFIDRLRTELELARTTRAAAPKPPPPETPRIHNALRRRDELEASAGYSGPPRSSILKAAEALVGKSRYRGIRAGVWRYRLWKSSADEADGPPETAGKRFAESLVGHLTYRRLRRFMWELREVRRGQKEERSFCATPSAIPGSSLPFGVNLFGYFDTESGVGEIARSMALALRHGGVPHALINVGQKWLRRNDRRFTEFSSSNPYSINLVMVNADQVPAVVAEFGEETFADRINVGYWFWELSQFPAAYFPSFRPFDEIWVASTFCLDAMSAVSPIRVVRVSPGFEFQSSGKRDRASFGIDPDEFIFLYVFDSASSLQRKNPAGAIRAFRDAFPNGGRERLILKTTNATPRQAAALQRLAGGSRVTLLTDYLDRDELLDLIATSNAYVSLHRSEGFGLTLLESMAFGKPVIATDYSGSHDFLNSANGFPVGYRLVPLRRTIGPYEKGSVWADPDLKEAAQCMRRIRQEPSERKRVGEAARADARNSWSIEASSQMIRQRLERLAKIS